MYPMDGLPEGSVCVGGDSGFHLLGVDTFSRGLQVVSSSTE